MLETAGLPSHVPSHLLIDFDPNHDAGLAVDVFQRLEQIRASSPPIAYAPKAGGWMFFREDLIQKAFSDGEHFSTSLFNAGAQSGAPDMIPLCLDPPENGPWRMAVVRQLTPGKIKRLEGFVRAKAETLIAPIAARPSCDFLKEVAEPMPISIFMELMGLPAEGYEEFRNLAVQIISPEGLDRNTPATAAANARIIEILADLIAQRREEPRDDLVSSLIQETVAGEPIGPRELLAICYVLFLGGLDTVVNAMSYGMRFLAMDAELQDSVRRDPATIPGIMEQLLRRSTFVNPLRLVKKDIDLEGITLKAGDIVWNMCGAASNAPESDTGGPRHLAFGGGYHMCAGMHLARLELRVLYETWFKHIGPFELDTDEGPIMAGGPTMLIKRLKLRLNAAN
ncbi:cytochrome P450 [Novosphingobium resinovorum]|uniref:Cytochrome P450 n=1 Tax=Novosphingobium resinovorum TaxID=158500 RepID=A0A031IYJ1_9SPHN|nr:cytochrome P450 [Novosphingobium resinovorum]EZP66273.1 Cytochrome P450 [Novosphingobium resinovorum]